jgi:tetratricopeptide (TPR) repeat protein
MKQFEKSLAAYQSVLDKIDARRDGFERLESGKVQLLVAKAYIDKGDVGQAKAMWQHVIDDKRSSDTDRANGHLWLGKFYDVEGKRPKALEEYNAILALQASPRLKEEAAKYKRQPFKW